MKEPSFLPPFTFRPILKPVIWGGSFIKYFKRLHGCSCGPIGESWEISGLEGDESVVDNGPDAGLPLPALIEKYGARLMGKRPYEIHGNRFPLLIKYIDAARDLSVQVHPDDEMAVSMGQKNGKSELWHIVRAAGGAKIHAGFRQNITPDEYERALSSQSIMDCVSSFRTRPGQTFYLPAGTIHAIGAGNFLLEIQQASGVTYRVYDYGRIDADGHPRELHTELARKALKYEAFDPRCPRLDGYAHAPVPLLYSEWANIQRADINGTSTLSLPADSFTILACISGELTLSYPGSDFPLPSGTTCLLEATIKKVSLSGRGAVVIITV